MTSIIVFVVVVAVALMATTSTRGRVQPGSSSLSGRQAWFVFVIIIMVSILTSILFSEVGAATFKGILVTTSTFGPDAYAFAHAPRWRQSLASPGAAWPSSIRRPRRSKDNQPHAACPINCAITNSLTQTTGLHRTMVKVCKPDSEGTIAGTRGNGEDAPKNEPARAGGEHASRSAQFRRGDAQ